MFGSSMAQVVRRRDLASSAAGHPPQGDTPPSPDTCEGHWSVYKVVVIVELFKFVNVQVSCRGNMRL